MNKTQQKALNAMVATLEQMESDLQALHDELQETHDGKSERWQESDAGQAAGDRINTLASVIDEISNASSQLYEAAGGGE